jgi:hypothetical protein
MNLEPIPIQLDRDRPWRHTAVTALRDSADAPAKAGVNRGHGVPVTPDERAPSFVVVCLRGRFVCKSLLQFFLAIILFPSFCPER